MIGPSGYARSLNPSPNVLATSATEGVGVFVAVFVGVGVSVLVGVCVAVAVAVLVGVAVRVAGVQSMQNHAQEMYHDCHD